MPDDIYSLLPHANKPQVLLLKSPTGWTLPCQQKEDARSLNAAMKTLFGCDTTVLSCIYDRYKDDERENQHRIYALENLSPAFPLPADAAWVSKSELALLELAIADHRAVLEQWLDQAVGHLSRGGVPWASPGWFSLARQWLQEQIEAAGLSQSRLPEQIQVSTWSNVLSVPTSTQRLYFKASSPVFAYEPGLTDRLAQLVPAHMPRVLAIDQQAYWMLTRDAGQPLSSYEDLRADPACWEEVLRLYARMQISLIGQQETLLAAGCPDRRLDLLPNLLEDALEQTELLALDSKYGLPQTEYVQLKNYLPQLRAYCAELKSHGIPESLHHDDLHGKNILFNGTDFVFFDWAESAITHPFCSLVIVERVFRHVLKFSEKTIAHLRDSYLREWRQFEPLERLESAYLLAQHLGKLCRAITWGRLLAHLSPDERWQCESSYPYWLRVFLGTQE